MIKIVLPAEPRAAFTRDAKVPADAIEEFGWRGARGRGRIFRDADTPIGFGNNGKDGRGRLPPVVSSLFAVKAAH